MKKFVIVCSLVFLTGLFSACGGGGGGGGDGDGGGGDGNPVSEPVSVNSLDGATDVAADSVFKYVFSQAINQSTVTENSFFIVSTAGASADVVKASLDPTACDPANALPGSVSCSSTTQCELTPNTELEPGTQYSICLTADILYDNGQRFVGFMATFTTVGGGGGSLSYTIGGSLSGLDGGEQVVLQNNGADDLFLNANGLFVFSTPVPDGNRYAVTVKTKPATKTCTVSRGTGTVADANVTNVSIVCSTNTYTIGGSLSGLGTSEEVILQNNSGDTLSISANGSFVFSTPVADGGGYAVSVLEKPATKTCTVGNGTGVVSGANVTNVSVVCSTNTYTIGGSLSGLGGGEHVILQNNGGNNLTISANGSLVFLTPVADGGSYAVSVLEKPVTKTCTVGNGSGIVSGTNVTDVNVVCSTNTYTIGGNVSSLDVGEQVVLQNNGSNDLIVNANGAFTFSTPVADGGGYSVTVLTSPNDKTCLVSNGTGTISGANVTNVSVVCSVNMYTFRSSDLESGDYFGLSVSTSGNYVIVGARQEDGGEGDPHLNTGAAYIFQTSGNNVWAEVAKLTASDAQEGYLFGDAVSISGDYAIIGSPHHNGGPGNPTPLAGAAYVFHNTGSNTWVEVAKLTASDVEQISYFGISVSINGDYAIVGAFQADGGPGWNISDAGAAYVFHNAGSDTWVEVAKLTASDGQADDGFGWSVSISGDYAIIGAMEEDGGVGDPISTAGAAYVFHNTGSNTWNQVAKLTASDAQAGDSFGYSVSISVDHIIVGAQSEDGGNGDPLAGAGAVYVFYNAGNDAWGQVAKLTASDSRANARFGINVSLSGDYALIGAYLANAAYIFHNTGSDLWEEVAKLTPPDYYGGGYFGCGVSISSDYSIVGAYGNDGGMGSPTPDAGIAYSFYNVTLF